MRHAWRYKTCEVVLNDCNTVEGWKPGAVFSVLLSNYTGIGPWSLLSPEQWMLVGMTRRHARACAVWMLGDSVLRLTLILALFSSGWSKNSCEWKHSHSQVVVWWEEKEWCTNLFFFFKHISNSSILSLLKSLFLLVSILLAEAYYMFSNFVYSIISSIVVFVVFYQYTDYLIPILQFPK